MPKKPSSLPAGWGKWSCTSTQHWWGTSGVLGPVLGPPRVKEMWTNWHESSEVPWRQLRTRSNWCISRGWERGDFSTWRREVSGGILSMCMNTKWEQKRRWSQAFLSGVQWQEAADTTWKRGFFPKHSKRDFFLM